MDAPPLRGQVQGGVIGGVKGEGGGAVLKKEGDEGESAQSGSAV